MDPIHELNASEAIDVVRRTDSVDQLHAAETQERANRNRSTVLAAIRQRRDQLGPPEEESPPPEENAPESPQSNEPDGDDEADDAEPDAPRRYLIEMARPAALGEGTIPARTPLGAVEGESQADAIDRFLRDPPKPTREDRPLAARELATLRMNAHLLHARPVVVQTEAAE